MRVVAVTGLKGGVGKTTTAVNLAVLAAQAGHRTVLWDLDPQAAATYCLDLKPKLRGGVNRLLGGRSSLLSVARGTTFDRLLVVPADASIRDADLKLAGQSKPAKPIRRLVTGAKGDVDVVVVDCPPGLSPVVEAVASIADVLLVPVIPERLPFRALDRFTTFLRETRSASPEIVAPFISMVDRRKSMHRRVEAEIRARGGFLGAAVPESSAAARLPEEQVPVVVAAPRSLAAQEYRRLWAEAQERAGL